MSKRNLSYDDCKTIALSYERIIDLAKGKDASVYNKIRREGWDELLSHMPRQTRILSYDICKEISQRYRTRGELKKHDKNVYDSIRDKGWDELFAHMHYVRRELTYEFCKSVASKCKTRSELERVDASVYNAIMKYNWHELFDHMDGNKKLSYDYCKKIVNQFTSRPALRRDYPSVYVKITQCGWNDLLDHMPYRREKSYYDSIYLWVANGLVGPNGHPVYKIGCATSKNAHRRIAQVARKAKVAGYDLSDYSIIKIRKLDLGNGLEIEAKMKSYGIPYRFVNKFDASSEFRELSKDQVETILKLMNYQSGRDLD